MLKPRPKARALLRPLVIALLASLSLVWVAPAQAIGESPIDVTLTCSVANAQGFPDGIQEQLTVNIFKYTPPAGQEPVGTWNPVGTQIASATQTLSLVPGTYYFQGVSGTIHYKGGFSNSATSAPVTDMDQAVVRVEAPLDPEAAAPSFDVMFIANQYAPLTVNVVAGPDVTLPDPLPTVELSRWNAGGEPPAYISDQSGQFTAKEVLAGTYYAKVTLNDFHYSADAFFSNGAMEAPTSYSVVEGSAAFAVEDQVAQTVSITINRGSWASVTGVVQNAQGPLAGAKVGCASNDTGCTSATTGADGKFSFDATAGQGHYFTVTATGHNSPEPMLFNVTDKVNKIWGTVSLAKPSDPVGTTPPGNIPPPTTTPPGDTTPPANMTPPADMTPPANMTPPADMTQPPAGMQPPPLPAGMQMPPLPSGMTMPPPPPGMQMPPGFTLPAGIASLADLPTNLMTAAMFDFSQPPPELADLTPTDAFDIFSEFMADILETLPPKQAAAMKESLDTLKKATAVVEKQSDKQEALQEQLAAAKSATAKEKIRTKLKAVSTAIKAAKKDIKVENKDINKLSAKLPTETRTQLQNAGSLVLNAV